MPFTVAIVGRPNVGKSTLFNRLIGRRLALVDDTPGVTRDRRFGEARLGDLDFTAVDTAGFEEATGPSLEARMRQQTELAVAEADLALLVIDARAGLTPLDEHFANLLRKSKTPVILVANKCEGRAGRSGIIETYSLGLGEPVAVSAEHGEGMADLYDAIRLHAEPAGPTTAEPDDGDTEPGAEDDPGRPLQLAIVGRPNVGKSTLVNRLIGEDRLLTGPEAGITRDAIAIDWRYGDREIRLIDTAGLRRRAKVTEKLEKLSIDDTLRTVRFAEVVVIVLDAEDMLEKQDLTIARLVVDEGRVPVIAVNKWDLIEDKPAALRRLTDRIETSLPQIKGIRTVTLSALTGRNLDRLMTAVFEAHAVWNKRASTASINRWLAGVTEQHPPPLVQGRRIKLRYATQIKTRPPTFALFVSRPESLPDSYLRYLENSLRDTFKLDGVPVRLTMRKGKNPYADKDD
jgi:GTP-binding protein